MSYNIQLHNHRFAVWAASTAARASQNCRFSVEIGKKILENIGFVPEFTIDNLPNANDFDDVHLKWRNLAITEAKKNGMKFTHGVAAKLINCYLKSRFVCAEYKHRENQIDFIHPPIDSLLLDELYRIKFGINKGINFKIFSAYKWSKFNAQQYQEIINAIRLGLRNKGLWRIEEHWSIHK